MEEFIREQIKEKPLNKRKIAVRLGVSALCGLVFAIVACLVMAFLLPALTGNSGDTVANNTESETMPITTEDTENFVEPVTETQIEPVTEQEPDSEIDYSISIEDYQSLQDELYGIGNDANASIVSIISVKSDTDWFNNLYESEGTGAGVIIAEDEVEYLIMTERKVIADAKTISVSFINEAVAEATLKKYDGNTGIAILSVLKKDLDTSTINSVKVAELGNSNMVSKGMITIALGSPLGTNYSILTGSITSTVNEMSTIDDNYSVFTTDIVSSKDGSGILINVQGQVIGLVIQDFSGPDSSTLTAVAISEVKPLLNLLMEGKDIPYLGLYVVTVTDKIAKDHKLPNGVYIKDVKLDSPAMMAGVQVGDIITEIDGRQINTVADYNAQLLRLTPDETYKIKVMRSGGNGYSEITLEAKIGVLQ